MNIAEFQKLIADTYLERDSKRGLGGTFMWFIEEVGELSTALLEGDREALKGEFADVFAWLTSLASIAGIEMSEVIEKYAAGCPACRSKPCRCSEK